VTHPLNEALDPPLNDAERALAERLRRHVEMLAGLIGPRHLGRPGSLEAAAEHVRLELESGGERVERQPYPLGEHRPENLVLERRGTTKPDEIVILGAHYDSVPETPGADDNASAVAVLLEAAKLLHGRATRRTVRFVAFTNEEPPHYRTGTMGSQVYARQCRDRREKIAGMLCLEMVGYFDTAPVYGNQAASTS
jgi:acetylornithine deacetylase/succinyl-diaminopimelate desuccinylase-like protein